MRVGARDVLFVGVVVGAVAIMATGLLRPSGATPTQLSGAKPLSPTYSRSSPRSTKPSGAAGTSRS